MKTTNIQTVPHAIKNRFKQAKFSLLFSVFSMAVVITLGSCSSSGSMMNTSYDDVYGTPSKKEMTASANAAAKTQQNVNTSDYYTGDSKTSANVENENTTADNRNFDQIQEEYREIPADQTLIQAETQATEEAYASDFEMDDYYDYAYAARLKRFYGDDISDRYYSDFYTNLYWYTGDPYYYGTSIYLGYNFWYPSSFYYRPGWYLGFSYGGFGYPSFGWGWGGSYWNGYWNGYMNGLYTGHWGHNCWGSYCYNPYDYNTYTQSYYGPRTGSGNTTGLPSRSPGLSTVSRDNPSGGRGSSSTTDRTTTLATRPNGSVQGSSSSSTSTRLPNTTIDGPTTDRTTTLATRPNGSVQGSSSSSTSTRLPNTTIDGPTTDRTTTLATRPNGSVQGSSSSSTSTRLPNTTIDGPTTEVSRPTFPEMYESSVSRQEMKVETGTKTPDIARPNTSTKLAGTSDRVTQSVQSTNQVKAPSDLIDRTSNRLERTSSTTNRVSGTSNGATVSRPAGNTSVVGRDNNHTIEATQKGQSVYGTSRGGSTTVNPSQSRGTNTISREAAAARQYQSPSYQRTPSNSSYSSPQYNRENTTYTPSRQSSTRSTATPSRSTSSTSRTVTQPSRTQQQQRTSPSTYTSPSPSRSFSTPSSSGVRSSGSSSSGGSRSSGGSSSGGRR